MEVVSDSSGDDGGLDPWELLTPQKGKGDTKEDTQSKPSSASGSPATSSAKKTQTSLHRFGKGFLKSTRGNIPISGPPEGSPEDLPFPCRFCSLAFGGGHEGHVHRVLKKEAESVKGSFWHERQQRSSGKSSTFFMRTISTISMCRAFTLTWYASFGGCRPALSFFGFQKNSFVLCCFRDLGPSIEQIGIFETQKSFYVLKPPWAYCFWELWLPKPRGSGSEGNESVEVAPDDEITVPKGQLFYFDPCSGIFPGIDMLSFAALQIESLILSTDCNPHAFLLRKRESHFLNQGVPAPSC